MRSLNKLVKCSQINAVVIGDQLKLFYFCDLKDNILGRLG